MQVWSIEQRGQSIGAILDGYPRFTMLKGQAPLESRGVPALLMRLQQEYSDGVANTLDGLRVDWPDQWFHVRVSQTESILRVIAERRSGSPRELFDAVMEICANTI